tara:strand:- start:365 stop:733 length:369 start_codon:yes stop_codon:yes gene_type:complete
MEIFQGLLFGLGFFFSTVVLALVIILIAARWKIFTKANQPGWASLIPIYNALIFLRIIGKPWWWIFLFCIPLVNIVFVVLALDLLSKSFGKPVWFTVGLFLLPFIFELILAFGDAKYIGSKK